MVHMNSIIKGCPKTQRYLAMLYETEGKLLEAWNIYKLILKEIPHDAITYKRLACLLRDSGCEAEAISTLNELLQIQMNDT